MAKNDWYEAGEAIRNLVQKAVEEQDFSQLSTTISNVVNQTVDGFQEALKDTLGGRPRDEKEAGRGQAGAGNFGSFGADRPSGTDWVYDEETGSYRAFGNYRTSPGDAAQRIRREVRERREKLRPVPVRYKAPGRVTGLLMAWTGYGFGTMFGLALAILILTGYATGESMSLACEIVGLLLGLSVWLGSSGSRRLGLARRFRRYISLLGERTWCTLEELASGTGESVGYVQKDLRQMIKKGFFPQGHLDRKETCLITDGETYRQYLQTQQEFDRRSAERISGGRKFQEDAGSYPGKETDGKARTGQEEGAPERSAAGSSEEASLGRECRELIEEGERYIAHIHACNDRIAGEEMSAKLDRLEIVVTRIFGEVEQRPELAPELRRMMSYYLPTTQKLIDAYCQLDGQPVRGQNIESTKKEIEDALDTINQAFENLLDSFFKDTAWDISSDISVLHTMFAQEGLTGQGFPGKKKEQEEGGR